MNILAAIIYISHTISLIDQMKFKLTNTISQMYSFANKLNVVFVYKGQNMFHLDTQ